MNQNSLEILLFYYVYQIYLVVLTLCKVFVLTVFTHEVFSLVGHISKVPWLEMATTKLSICDIMLHISLTRKHELLVAELLLRLKDMLSRREKGKWKKIPVE